jgi:hypothetical protein
VPPQVLVDGVRSLLIYDVQTTGPNPRVFVDGGTGGQLAGVLGSDRGVADLAETIATYGMAAAVAQPLVGGPTLRQVSIALGDDAPPPPVPMPPTPAPVPKPPVPKPPVPKPPVPKPPVLKPPAKKVPAKKAVPAKKVPAKKIAKKAAPKATKKAVKKVTKKATKKAAKKRAGR